MDVAQVDKLDVGRVRAKVEPCDFDGADKGRPLRVRELSVEEVDQRLCERRVEFVPFQIDRHGWGDSAYGLLYHQMDHRQSTSHNSLLGVMADTAHAASWRLEHAESSQDRPRFQRVPSLPVLERCQTPSPERAVRCGVCIDTEYTYDQVDVVFLHGHWGFDWFDQFAV